MSIFKEHCEIEKCLYQIKKYHFSEIGPLQSSVSPILYHYTTIDSLLSILKSGSLRLSNVKFCNDPNEVQYGINFLQRFWDDIGGNYLIDESDRSFHREIQRLLHLMNYSLCSKDIRDDLIKKLDQNPSFLKVDTSFENSKHQSFLFCLSEDGDNLRQWFPYADGGNGVCLGFKNLRNDNDSFFQKKETLLKTVYKSYDLILSVIYRYFQNLHSIYKNVKESEIQNDINDSSFIKFYFELVSSQILSLIFSLKDAGFEDEREHRFIISDRENNIKNDIEFLSNKGVIKPYIEAKFNKDSLVEIKLGPKCEKMLNEHSLESLLSFYEYKNAKITHSKKSLR